MSNPCLEAVEAELTKAHVPYSVSLGGKHVHIRFGDKREHLHVVAATPSDHRAPLNERALIRRELVRLGYVANEADARPLLPFVSLTNGSPTCASYHVADHFDKAHKDVLRAIDRVREECGTEFDQRNFAPIDYLDTRGRTYRAYAMTRDGFSLVVMGFTGRAATEWKIKYIDAFGQMERQIALPAAGNDEVLRLRGEVDAALGLLAEMETRIAPPVRMRKQPFVRPSILRRARRAA